MSWRKILWVARYEYRTNVRRWGFRLTTLGFPLLGLVVLLVAQWVQGDAGLASRLKAQFVEELSGPVGYVDEAGIVRTPLEGFLPFEDEGTGKAALERKEISALLVIPSDYREGKRIRAYTRRGGVGVLEGIQERARALLAYNLLEGKVDPETLALVLKPVRLDPVVVGAKEKRQGPADLFVPYGFTILFFISIFTAAGFLLQGVAEEKESRIMEILLSSLSPLELLWGKVLGLGALGLTQLLIWMASGAVLLQRAGNVWTVFRQLELDPGFVALALGLVLLGYLLYAVLMAGLGSLGGTTRESQQIAGLVSFLAVIPMMFNSLFFLSPNGAFARALSYFPWTAPIATLLRLAFVPLPGWELALIFASLGLGVAVSAWIGARLFQAGVLLYGKRPTPRVIWRILRGTA